MTCGEEVTQWIVKLSNGDERAARMLWNDYFDKLARYARRKLEGFPCRAVDEEDVALSAMHSFCRGMAGRRFPQVEDREDLWKLLLTITARKVTAQKRRHFAAKRGGGQVRGESVFVRANDDREANCGIGEVLGSSPTPELAHMLAEDCRQLLDSLSDESLRQVAMLSLEGYTTVEIADKLGCVRRTVERKLERIRDKWSHENVLNLPLSDPPAAS
jgi:DNA-directed RNA polymerase specialized sigma24 family protein